MRILLSWLKEFVDVAEPATDLAATLGMTVAIWLRWSELDALLMGEEGALSLGVDVAPVRRRLILMTSFIIGACVSAGGMIGFVTDDNRIRLDVNLDVSQDSDLTISSRLLRAARIVGSDGA